MKELTIKEMQNIELDILIFLKNICEKNNLKYYLAYGTLIGAIRHGGFIPWDDDIDVMMPREDYEKLIEIVNNSNNNTTYKMICIDSDANFTAPLAKIIDTRTKLVQHYGFIEKIELGVYIDIFIIDGVPGNYENGKKYYDEAYAIYRKWSAANTMMFQPRVNKIVSFLRWIKRIPLKIIGYKYWLNKLEEHNKRYSFYNCEYVSVLEAGTKVASRNVWPRSYFGDKRKVIFENQEFAVPDNYDAILRAEYGNYMKLPPIDKQISHHYTKVYWR